MDKYKKRVIKEYVKLRTKYRKLGDFVCNIDKFYALNQLEQYLLNDQMDAMGDYMKSLEMRLIYWGIDIDEL